MGGVRSEACKFLPEEAEKENFSNAARAGNISSKSRGSQSNNTRSSTSVVVKGILKK